MLIEYFCKECTRSLQVPNLVMGHLAKCPFCETLTTIPSPKPVSQQEIFLAEEAERTEAISSDNSVTQHSENHVEEERLVRHEFSSMAAFRVARTHLFNNFSLCIYCQLSIILLLSILAGFFAAILYGINQFVEISSGYAAILGWLFLIPASIPVIWLTCGLVNVSLQICRTGKSKIQDLFTSSGMFWEVFYFVYMIFLLNLCFRYFPLILSVLFSGLLIFLQNMLGMPIQPSEIPLFYYLISLLTYLICGVLKIVIEYRFFLTNLLIIDKKMVLHQALKESVRLMKGNKFNAFLSHLLFFLLSLFIFVITFGAALFVILPFSALFYTAIYLAIIGEPLESSYQQESFSFDEAVSDFETFSEPDDLIDYFPEVTPDEPIEDPKREKDVGFDE